MKQTEHFLINTIIAAFILFTNSCSQAEEKNDLTSDVILVASTPGDSLIKSLLGIQNDIKVDFIRWEMMLKSDEGKNNSQTFVLNIDFGEAQANTTGFVQQHELTIEGDYSIDTKLQMYNGSEIYRLNNNLTSGVFSLVKLNDNLFHLLTPDDKLMVGNGGWSYSLNRKEPVADIPAALPSLNASLPSTIDTSMQLVFDGRTPCDDFAKEYNLPVSSDCFKLKWRITLRKGPNTLLPTTYTLQRTEHYPNKIEGTWSIVKGTKANPDAIIYQLETGKPESSLFLLVGDENVLFLLDKDQQLYVGNEDFSYTFNKKGN